MNNSKYFTDDATIAMQSMSRSDSDEYLMSLALQRLNILGQYLHGSISDERACCLLDLTPPQLKAESKSADDLLSLLDRDALEAITDAYARYYIDPIGDKS